MKSIMTGMPAKTAPKKKQDFEGAFNGLRKLLKPYDKKLKVVKDAPGGYFSESKTLRYQGKAVMFAAVTTKSYVSLHLFPVYMFPTLLKDISPELKKRMQGMTCWNFKQPDEKLFAELSTLFEASFRKFEEIGLRNLSPADLKSIGKAKTAEK